MRHRKALVACVLIISAAVRIVPALSSGRPYGFDIYDFLSRVEPGVKAGRFVTDLPQGPLLYSLLAELYVLGGIGLEDASSFIAPVIMALSVLPAMIYTKETTGDEDVVIVAGLLAASTNVIVHQTGGTVVPEGFGVLFAGFGLTLLIRVDRKDPKDIVLLCLAMIGVVVAHHLTTLNVLLGLGLATLFLIILSARRKIDTKEAVRSVVATSLLGIAALLTWKFIIPRHTLEVMGLTVEAANTWTLISGGLLASLPILASCRLVLTRRASDRLARRPFTLSVVALGASMAIPLLLYASGQIGSEMLRMVLYVGAPLCVVYVPLTVIGLASIVNSTIEERVIVSLVAFPVACSSLAIFLLMQPGLGTLAYRELPFILYSLLPICGVGLIDIIRRSSPGKRYVTAFIVAYSILALASTAYPPRSYLLGLSELYQPSDLRIADITAGIVPSKSPIDTDLRLGNALFYYSGRDVDWVSNVTYWTNPGPAWLGKSAMAGSPLEVPANVSFILISESMLKSNGGVVVDLLSRRLYPLPDVARDYLNEDPGISKVADTGTATLYQIVRHRF
jgi:hypothetical protein